VRKGAARAKTWLRLFREIVEAASEHPYTYKNPAPWACKPISFLPSNTRQSQFFNGEWMNIRRVLALFLYSCWQAAAQTQPPKPEQPRSAPKADDRFKADCC
jgi:hypothetical protein